MQRFDKYTLQTLGFALVLIGILLLLLGLLGGPQQNVACPVSGCPPSVLPWYWWIPSASFFSGTGLIITGIILLIVARSMKPKQRTDATFTQAPENE